MARLDFLLECGMENDKGSHTPAVLGIIMQKRILDKRNICWTFGLLFLLNFCNRPPSEFGGLPNPPPMGSGDHERIGGGARVTSLAPRAHRHVNFRLRNIVEFFLPRCSSVLWKLRDG